MKKVHGALISFFAVVLLSVSVLLYQTSPTNIIVGTWEEISWEYEKINKNDASRDGENNVQLNEISKNLVIHRSEIWEFDSDNNLKLYDHGEKMDESENLLWSLKGRGHILELKHRNSQVEAYQIQELSKNKLVIHFSFDLQVRGIVKMTFKRRDKKHAQKI